MKRREKLLLGLLALALAAALLNALRHRSASPDSPHAASRQDASLEPIPRIDLDRLLGKSPEAQVGERDLFGFGSVPAPPPPAPPASTPALTATPPPQVPVVPLAASLPRLPPLNLKYIGSVENAKGVKVAVLLTDRNEVLTGQTGEVVANRYRVAKIGIESVDLEELDSGQTRRIPLRGN